MRVMPHSPVTPYMQVTAKQEKGRVEGKGEE